MAVLSACETGQSPEATGDELIGLSAAFFQAGCRSLVASLWEANHGSAALLTETFYRRMLAGDDVAEALRQAQRTVRETYPQPFYWTPFAAIGER